MRPSIRSAHSCGAFDSRSGTAVKAAVLFLPLSLLLFLILTGCGTTMPPEVSVIRTAHRGGAQLAPENTLAAFAAGLKADADALEMDLHLSRDGRIMVIHDSALGRTAGQSGMVHDYDAVELARLDASAGWNGTQLFGFQPIPTLEQVLDLIAQRAERPVLLQLEIKTKSDGSRYPGIEERLVAVLRERNLIPSAIVISFDFPTLERIHELEPELKRAALISRAFMTKIGTGGPKRVADAMEALGVDFVGINFQYLTQVLYEEFRARGLGVGVWTVNQADDMRRLAAMGVDFITTDRPDLLKTALNPDR